MSNVISLKEYKKIVNKSSKNKSKRTENKNRKSELYEKVVSDSYYKVVKYDSLLSLRYFFIYQQQDPDLERFVSDLIIQSLKNDDHFILAPQTLCDMYSKDVVDSVPLVRTKVNFDWLKYIEEVSG